MRRIILFIVGAVFATQSFATPVFAGKKSDVIKITDENYTQFQPDYSKGETSVFFSGKYCLEMDSKKNQGSPGIPDRVSITGDSNKHSSTGAGAIVVYGYPSQWNDSSKKWVYIGGNCTDLNGWFTLQ